MWELGTIEDVGNITCSREPFLHRASAHHEQKIYLRDDDIHLVSLIISIRWHIWLGLDESVIHILCIHMWSYAMFAQTLLNMLIEQMPQIVEQTCGDNIE